MKKILFTIFATAALLGCSEGDRGITPATPGAIAFGNVSTRVDSASEIEEFSVWATVSSITDGAVNPEVSYVPILENERVYRNPAGSDTWTYDNTEYWISNSWFHFFAAYPYNLGIEQIRQAANGQSYTGYFLEVTADGTADTQDILVATCIKDTTSEGMFDMANPPVVPVSFKHLLSKLKLTISQNTDIDPEFEYYITKITITGICDKGTYMVMPLNNQFFETIDTSGSTTISIEKDYEDAPICLREPFGNGRQSKPHKVFGDDGVMMIPQEIAVDAIEIKVDYLYDVNPDDEDLGTPKSKTGYIPAITWESNKSYHYNLSIANTSAITFDQPTIEPWGSPQTGGTIIIK